MPRYENKTYYSKAAFYYDDSYVSIDILSNQYDEKTSLSIKRQKIHRDEETTETYIMPWYGLSMFAKLQFSMELCVKSDQVLDYTIRAATKNNPDGNIHNKTFTLNTTSQTDSGGGNSTVETDEPKDGSGNNSTVVTDEPKDGSGDNSTVGVDELKDGSRDNSIVGAKVRQQRKCQQRCTMVRFMLDLGSIRLHTYAILLASIDAIYFALFWHY